MQTYNLNNSLTENDYLPDPPDLIEVDMSDLPIAVEPKAISAVPIFDVEDAYDWADDTDKFLSEKKAHRWHFDDWSYADLAYG